MCRHACTYFSTLSTKRVWEPHQYQGAHLALRSWFLNIVLNFKEPGLPEKNLTDSRPGQEKYNISMDFLTLREERKHSKNDGDL